eukprot:2048906-Pleurochrysis_carterae.AAC.1
MTNATGVPWLHSVACCHRAAHASASTQALRNGALRPLPLPPPLAIAAPSPRSLPGRAARPANRG